MKNFRSFTALLSMCLLLFVATNAHSQTVVMLKRDTAPTPKNPNATRLSNAPADKKGTATRQDLRRNPYTKTCGAPMDDYAFRASIAQFTALREGFVDRAVRDFTHTSCLSVNQISQLTNYYRSEGDRLAYVLDAYAYCFDPLNYTALTAAFTNLTYRDQLVTFIKDNEQAYQTPNPQYNPNPNPRYDPNYPPQRNPNYPPNTNPQYDPNYNPNPNTQYDPNYNPNTQYDPNYNPNTPPPPVIGTSVPHCTQPMSPAEFIEAKRAVQQQTTDDLRIDFAKQIATNNCFTNQQVREMLSAFSFDDRRLEFAELAYDRSVDPRNYYRVAEALSFAANRKALLSYLNDNPVPVYEAPAPSYTPANPYPTPRGGYQPYVPNYTGRVGLNRPPLSETEFVNIRAALANQSFEDTRFSTAKQTLAARCVTVAQVVELTRLFQYESTRLDFAKFAYGRTFDIDNYYLVNDAFEFDSSRQALQEFVASRP